MSLINQPLNLLGQAAAPAGGNPISFLVSMVVIFGIFYFLIIRPQQKKQSDLRKQIEAIKKGDKVVTAGGIVGVVSEVKDNGMIAVKIAENVKVDVVRAYVSGVLNGENDAAKK